MTKEKSKMTEEEKSYDWGERTGGKRNSHMTEEESLMNEREEESDHRRGKVK
jgi:hypothetical protein